MPTKRHYNKGTLQCSSSTRDDRAIINILVNGLIIKNGLLCKMLPHTCDDQATIDILVNGLTIKNGLLCKMLPRTRDAIKPLYTY